MRKGDFVEESAGGFVALALCLNLTLIVDKVDFQPLLVAFKHEVAGVLAEFAHRGGGGGGQCWPRHDVTLRDVVDGRADARQNGCSLAKA